MDMDDNKSTIQVDPSTKIVIPLVLFVTIIGAASFYIYTFKLAPAEAVVSNQFNRTSALMRHSFKVFLLTHKAHYAYLVAILNHDPEMVDDAIDFMKASLGFMNVGYIDNESLIEHVAPVINKTILLLETTELNASGKAFAEIRDNFKNIFWELGQIENNINISIQQLYTRQQLTEKRWKLFYMLIAGSAIIGLLIIAALSLKQRTLINKLKDNEKRLRVHIEERKQDELEKAHLTEQLHQAKKMESIGLMAGGVAHDLNNILAGIVGYPELMLRGLPENSEMRKPIEAIQESGNRAALVVEDLLTVARGVAITMQDHDLHTIIREYLASPECEKLLSSYPSILFELRLDADKPQILCSPVHIKKCIMNLLTNAVEAVKDDGTVVLSTDSAEDADRTEGSFKQTAGYVKLSVRDSGPGISDTDLKHIFDPFYSKKVMGRSGTGLGLTVVWNTLKDHGGKVTVENIDDGACFQLYFPMGKGEVVENKEHEDFGKIRGHREHILVVDDEPHLRDLASQMLLTMDYTVDSVQSGELAVEFVKHSPVDLIILDMSMEPGMNGRKTYEEIIKLYPEQKAIIASGFSESDDVKAVLQHGASHFINKPFSMHRLGLVVKEALNT